METAKRMIFLLILVVLVISPVQSEEKQQENISNTRNASCLVKITCDPAILPLNLDTVDYLLHSSGVGGRACSEVLGISPDQDYDLFNVEYIQSFSSEEFGGASQSSGDSRKPPSPMIEEGMDEYEYAMMMEMEMEMEMGNSMMGRSVRSPRSRQPARSTRRTPPTGRAITSTFSGPEKGRTYLFSLNVHLPEDVKPMAKEFMQILLAYLRESLHEAHNVYYSDLKDLLKEAESRRDQARSRLEEVVKQIKAVGSPPEIEPNPAYTAVYERLEEIVDLSSLEASTSFADVLDLLKNSVAPPLQIQPNWRDLLENAEIEPTTPAGMDPLTGIKLRKALEILLDGVSSDFAEVSYIVDEGVILIATPDSLPNNMVPGVYDIPALAYSPGSASELIETIQNTIDPESWFELSDLGEATITPYPRQRPKKLAILQTHENHQKIWRFLQNIDIDIPTGSPSDIPQDMLLGEKDNLLAEKRNLEMELARARGRIPAIEVQIVRIKKEIEKKIQDDQISRELRKILDLQIRHLESVKKLAESGRAQAGQVADAEEKVARANIELAKRRDQIGASAGSEQLIQFTNELAKLAIDMAEAKAMLDVVKKQLDQTQQQLTVADMRDPQVSRIRMAAQALEIAERHVSELNNRLVNLQLPNVSVLGGN